MKKLVLSTLLALQTLISFAQTPTGVLGKVVDSKTQKPLESVIATIANTNLIKLTDSKGNFNITGVATGLQMLQIKTEGYKEQLLQVDIESGRVLELGTIYLEADVTSEQQNALITISETELNDGWAHNRL